MQRLLRLIIFVTLSFATFTLRAQTDDAHSVQEARTVKYAAKDIVRITTRPRFTTLILLPRGAVDQLTCTGVSLYRRPRQHQENPRVLSRA